MTATEREQFHDIKYQIGILCGKSGGEELPDIKVFFVHYDSCAVAKEKWVERYKRVNYDNLYFVMDRGMDAKDTVIDYFYSSTFGKRVFFTDKLDTKRWQNNFNFSYYTPEKYESGCLYRSIRKGLATYIWLDEFDYVHWINTGTIRRTSKMK